MSEQKDLVGLMNDLLLVNRDRAAGYQKAIDELKSTDIDLKTMFTNMANNSTQNAAELEMEIQKFGGSPEQGSSLSGKVYRVWMEIRAAASAHDRKSILATCELGEDAALKAYESALDGTVALPKEVKQIVDNQRSSIKSSHDVVKRYRDMHQAVEH